MHNVIFDNEEKILEQKMKKVKYTQNPNTVYSLKAELDASEYDLLTIIVRNTIGYHKMHCITSLKEMHKYTNLSNITIKKALDCLVKRNLIAYIVEGRKYTIFFDPEECDRVYKEKEYLVDFKK